MSQMVTRKRTGGDEKERDPQRQTDSPVKDMKKKMAANAEKEKNALDKPVDKTEKPAGKPADKPAEKPAGKPAEKPAEKSSEKPAEKTDKPKSADKPADKTEKPKAGEKVAEKPAEKKTEKPVERKSDAQSEKKKEDSKAESSGKTEKPDQKKHDTRDKPKQNGSSNGVNGTVSGGGDSDSDELVIDENDENDEIFPELAYEDSDVEWEPGMDAPSRSLTRRSQVKVARTPETPRPASDKLPEDESKDTKVLKLNQESGKTSDSPKPEAKKPETRSDAKQDSPKTDAKKAQGDTKESPKVEAKKDAVESPKKDEGKGDKSDKVEVEVVVEIESSSDVPEESRKPDTNYSKSRVKVSPYRRSVRLADQTTSSVTANYTGNNTTMEMDITESSSLMEESLDDSYLSGLRSIRGRRSYKPLKEMSLRNISVNRSARSNTSITAADHSRPTGTVVGRKRKPDADDLSLASEAEELPAAGKRQRLIERLARPFRRTVIMPARRNAEIVGINTDLPLSAPVGSGDAFDPESLKGAPPAPPVPSPAPPALAPRALVPEDSKRCVLM